MRFLVTLDGSDLGAGMPPERLAQVVDQMVVPSLEKTYSMGTRRKDSRRWLYRCERVAFS